MSFFDFDNTVEFSLLGRDLKSGAPSVCYGLSDPLKYLVGALVQDRAVYVTRDALTAQRAAEAIGALSQKKVALLSAKDEVLFYRRALSKDALFKRLTALYEWQKGADILVGDIEAFLDLCPKEITVFSLKTGQTRDMRAFAEELVRAGYTREYTVESKGSFALRGDILDIYPVNLEHPVRIDFFGDEIESIKPYDEITGERLPLVSETEILAATDVKLQTGEEEHIKEIFRKELSSCPNAEAKRRLNDVFAEIESDGFRSDFLLPVLQNSVGFFEAVGRDTLVIFDESKEIMDKTDALYKEHYERFMALKEGGEVASFSQNQYVPYESVLNFGGRKALALSSFTGKTYFFEPLKMHRYTASPVRRYLGGLSDLYSDLSAWSRTGYRVVLFCGNGTRTQKLQDELADNGFACSQLTSSMLHLKGIAVSERYLAHGFLLHESKLAVIGTDDLFLKTQKERRIKKRRGDLFVAPEVGDYAVHENYGVGKIVGTKKIETTDGVKEYVALEYRDGDTLYVPVEQMDALSKYMGEENPTLSKIGGGEFERVKARVRASLKKMAFDLKQLYAERNERRGYAFHEYREEMEEFAAAFPYEETADQLTSLEEIEKDMCSDKVMDRLLCGDVGFGKTEVAFRAAYRCILEGKQAALMCPSTVLSEQHFRTATERMKDFGVRVEALNRFRTEKEQKATLAALERGDVDLIIGTHRLLSDDVKFHDLGLLLLDEEQRFGVEHKEKIKNMKRNVDCLTMTATPIPRTLHLSLSGIRDISTIQTPPRARLPVQTYVAEETETLLRDACMREIARKGQVFLLYNRVESIFSFARRLQEILPEARVAVAHGRMDKTTLENNVFGFYQGRSDILVTTTIIENGIDLPNANTLIVIDADRLGISQLYQLRGRVGRGTHLAHAYFTYKPERVMTENASERLKAIMQFTELGSGFKIAMRDLEIRGAGNVLGAEQHGHMDKVGYELYSKILKEEITGEKQESVDLDIKTTAFIPESYIESAAGRMDSYKQIAEIRNAADYKRVCTSMEETYGALPPEALNLLVIAVMKSYASKFHVKKISVGSKGGAMEFSSLSVLGDKRLIAAMEKYKGDLSLDMTSAPVLKFRFKGDGGKTMIFMTKFLKFAISFS